MSELLLRTCCCASEPTEPQECDCATCPTSAVVDIAGSVQWSDDLFQPVQQTTLGTTYMLSMLCNRSPTTCAWTQSVLNGTITWFLAPASPFFPCSECPSGSETFTNVPLPPIGGSGIVEGRCFLTSEVLPLAVRDWITTATCWRFSVLPISDGNGDVCEGCESWNFQTLLNHRVYVFADRPLPCVVGAVRAVGMAFGPTSDNANWRVVQGTGGTTTDGISFAGWSLALT